MRKIVYLCFICSCMLFVSGCSSISLTCIKETKSVSDFATSSQKYNIIYKNDTIYKINATTEVVFSENTLKSDENIIDNMAATSNSEFDYLEGKRGFSSTISKKSDGYVYKFKINFNKLDDESKKSITFINYKDSFSTMKKNLEKNGFDCK